MSTAEWWATVTTFLTAVGALGFSWFNWRNARNQPAKDSADAAESLSKAAAGLVQPLRDEIKLLRAQQAKNVNEIACLTQGQEDLRADNARQSLVIRRQDSRITALSAGVRILTDQIRRAGLHPEWEPPADPAEP